MTYTARLRCSWTLLPLLAVFLFAGPARAQETTAGAATATVPEAEPIAGYHHGFFIRAPDGPYELRLQARVQARYTAELLDGGDNESAFALQRARLTLAGRALTDGLEYKFQADFGRGFVTLKDFYVDYAVLPDWLHLRAGQWKRPFSREQITSSGSLELVDRSIADRFFGAGRDIGLALHNDYEHSPTFEYALGVFNGTGDGSHLSGTVQVDPTTNEGEITGGRFSNVPDHFDPALALRLGYNYGGIKGYSQGDLEGGPFRLSLATSLVAHFDTDDDDTSGLSAEVDFIAKVAGFSASGAMYASWAQDGGSFGDQTLAALGLLVQAGYVIAGRVQPVVRYTLIDPDGEDNNRQEIGGGVSVYFFGHSLKWQSDALAEISQQSGGGDRTDWLLRSQLQLSF